MAAALPLPSKEQRRYHFYKKTLPSLTSLRSHSGTPSNAKKNYGFDFEAFKAISLASVCAPPSTASTDWHRN